jgi:hypothetical protein
MHKDDNNGVLLQTIIFVADTEAEKRVWLHEIGRTITSLIDPYLKKKRTRNDALWHSSLCS